MKQNTDKEKQQFLKDYHRMTESQNLYSSIVESCADGVMIIDNGLIRYVNQSLLDMTGYALDEAIGEPFSRYVLPEYSDIAIDHYTRRMAGLDSPTIYDLALVKKDQSVVIVEINASRILFDNRNMVMVVIRDRTERSQLTRQIQEKDDFLNNIIDQTPNALWISDIEGNVIRMNQALANILVLTEDDVVGHYNVLKDSQVIDQGHIEEVRSVFEKGATVNFTLEYDTGKEEQIKSQEKSFRYLEIQMSPVKDTYGTTTNVLCQIQDITSRVLAEKSLIESEEKYRSLFDHSYDGILLTSPDGQILSANPAACRIFQMTEDEIRQAGRNGIMDVADPRLSIAIEHRNKNGFFRGELTAVRKNGEKFEAEFTSVLFKDPKGNDRTSMIFRDNSERKKAERLVQLSEEQYRIISELSSDYMYVYRIDENRKITLDWISGAFEAITGYTVQEFKDLPSPGLSTHPEDFNLVADQNYRVIHGETVQSESRLITKNGETRWIRNRQKPVWNEDHSRIVAIYGTSEDITRQKNLELSLRNSNRILSILGQCNQALVRSEDEQSLLDEICRLIVEEGGHRLAWIGYKEHNENKDVRIVSQYGVDNGYLSNIVTRWSESPYGNGPTGTTIRTGETTVINNAMTNPSLELWRDQVFTNKFLSIISLPLRSGDEVFGALTINADDYDAFSTEEITLLTELASDISYGIGAIRSRIERDNAEAILRDNEIKLKEISRIQKTGSFEFDVVTKSLVWDDQMYDIFEWNSEVGVPSHMESLHYFDQNQRDLLYELGYQVIQNKTEAETELTITIPQGPEKRLSLFLRPVTDATGIVTRIFGIVQDISRLKEAEESLRLFDAALKSIHDCVYAIDTDFKIIYWNEACEKTFGVPADKAIGQPIGNVLNLVEDYPGQNRTRLDLLFDRRYNREEMRMISPNGTIWMDTLSQIIEQDGVTYGWLTITTDISEKISYLKRQQLIVDVLNILNAPVSQYETLKNLTDRLKDFTQAQAVAIRLKSEDTFPYVCTNGLSEWHIKQDNLMQASKQQNNCMCGHVLSGVSDIDAPFFTSDGSFWTNSLSDLVIANTSDAYQLWQQSACLKEKFESIALIPLRSASQVIGMVQVVDRKKDLFSPEMIEVLENIGLSIGIAMDRSITQEELRLEKERMERIYNTAQTIIVMIDTDGNIVDMNPYMEKLSGYTLSEIQGKNWFDTFIPERERTEIKHLFYSAVGGTSTKGNINAIVTKSGQERQIVWYDTVIKDDEGNIISLLSTGQDITDEMQLEELYSTVTTKAPIGVYIIQNKKMIFTNPEFSKVTGYSTEELNQRSPDMIVCPEDLDEVKQNSALMLKGLRTTPYEYRFINANGELKWAMETLTSINYNGKRAALGCFLEITENKIAEEAVRQSEEKLKIIIESIPQGIIVTDLNGNIVQTNIAAMSLFGLDTDIEIIGANALKFVQPDFQSTILRSIRNARYSEKPKTFNYTALKSDGMPFKAEMTVAYIRDTSGAPVSVLGLIEDVSERIRLQEQLVVTDRLASVGELAAGIAHELNNPLTGVIGFSDLLLTRNDLPEDIRDDINVINQEAIRASQVARHLLTFARKHPDEKSAININEVLEIVMQLRSYEQRVNNIAIEKSLDPHLGYVQGNEFQLQQVFINIIINAEYFMIEEHGGGILQITTEQDKNQVRIIIGDNGPGIPSDVLPYIFNPFYTTKEVGKGTGLGLSICHGIITEHGGTLRAESIINQGTRFIVELPVSSVALQV